LLNKLVLLWLGLRVEVTGASSPETVSESAPLLLLDEDANDDNVMDGEQAALLPPLAVCGVAGAPPRETRERLGGVGG
jgi:hypothetical protein